MEIDRKFLSQCSQELRKNLGAAGKTMIGCPGVKGDAGDGSSGADGTAMLGMPGSDGDGTVGSCGIRAS